MRLGIAEGLFFSSCLPPLDGVQSRTVPCYSMGGVFINLWICYIY